MEGIMELMIGHLEGQEQETALAFAEFLQSKALCITRDMGFWKDKIYYIMQYRGEGVCYIAIADPDEPQNRWTVWSEDMDCTETVQATMAECAWKYVDHCGSCGSCGGGRRKLIFGREFEDVCGCTFRVDNPGREELAFLKQMVQIRMHEIDSQYERKEVCQ